MTDILRYSPIRFDPLPVRTEIRDGYEVVLEYRDQGKGPYLVDLSHLPRWDLQNGALSRYAGMALPIPAEYNSVNCKGGLLISRLNATQCQMWALEKEIPGFSADVAITEISDGQALLALVGCDLRPLVETLTSLDLFIPDMVLPRLSQGPVLKIPSQVIRLADWGDLQSLLLGFPRGYGQAMADAVLERGTASGLVPGGEEVFTSFIIKDE